MAEYETFRKNPATDAIIEAIRSWEEAKRSGAFSDEQRARLKDPERDFHLERTGEERWSLQDYEKFRFEHTKKVLQPGEPTHSEWTFENAFEPQPLHLSLLLTGGEDATAKDLTVEVDRFFRVAVPATLKKGQSLVWDGSERMALYDEKGRKLETVEVGQRPPLLQRGKHSVGVDARFAGGDPVIKGTVKIKGAVEAAAR